MKSIIAIILVIMLILLNWNKIDIILFNRGECEPHTDSITLISKSYSIPLPEAPYNEKHCLKVGDGITELCVPVPNCVYTPELIIHKGCSDCGDMQRPPLMEYSLAPWIFEPNIPTVLPDGTTLHHRFKSSIMRAQGSTGCCVSVELGFYDPFRGKHQNLHSLSTPN
jgi:hypothetical protein